MKKVGFEGAVEDPAYRTSDYQVLISDVPMLAEAEASSPFGKGGLRGILKNAFIQ